MKQLNTISSDKYGLPIKNNEIKNANINQPFTNRAEP